MSFVLPLACNQFFVFNYNKNANSILTGGSFDSMDIVAACQQLKYFLLFSSFLIALPTSELQLLLPLAHPKESSCYIVHSEVSFKNQSSPATAFDASPIHLAVASSVEGTG